MTVVEARPLIGAITKLNHKEFVMNLTLSFRNTKFDIADIHGQP